MIGKKDKGDLMASTALALAEVLPSAMQTWAQYNQAREQRLALEATLDAEVRMAEVKLEALYAKLEASSNFLTLQLRDNSEKRAVLKHAFDLLHSTVQQYVEIHVRLILSASSEDERNHAAAVWNVIEPLVLQMGKITTAVSNQTIGWLEL